MHMKLEGTPTISFLSFDAATVIQHAARRPPRPQAVRRALMPARGRRIASITTVRLRPLKGRGEGDD